jgi:hypothetical protein
MERARTEILRLRGKGMDVFMQSTYINPGISHNGFSMVVSAS